MVDRGPIYTERLFEAAMKETDIVSRTTILKSDSVLCVFCFFLFHGLACFDCVLVPSTLLAFHLLYTLINCDCLVYSVSQSVTTK